MPYRTFFTVRLDESVVSLNERATYLDIGDQLTVEQVAARLSGTKLGIADMAIAFPDALRAAQVHASMRRNARFAEKLRGPFVHVTPTEPTDDALVDWYIKERDPSAKRPNKPVGAPDPTTPRDSGVARGSAKRRPRGRKA